MLLAKQMMTTLKCICPFKTFSPSKQAYLREADTSSVLFNKRDTPHWEAIKNKQKQTGTMDPPGCTLPPVCSDVLQAEWQMSLSERERGRETDNLSTTFSCYNEVSDPLCVSGRQSVWTGVLNQTEPKCLLVKKKTHLARLKASSMSPALFPMEMIWETERE